MKIAYWKQEGVVVELNGKYWGKVYDNINGFGDLGNAKICDPKFCKKPTDLTYGEHSPDYKDLSNAKMMKAERVTTIKVY